MIVSDKMNIRVVHSQYNIDFTYKGKKSDSLQKFIYYITDIHSSIVGNMPPNQTLLVLCISRCNSRYFGKGICCTLEDLYENNDVVTYKLVVNDLMQV